MSERSATDPFATWREMLDKQTEAWTKLMAETMGTEAFAAALGRQMETYLSTQGQLQKRFLEVMEQYLKSLNLPSRTDLSRLAAQVGAVEAKVDEQDVRADELVALLEAIQSAVQRLDTRLGAIEQAQQATQREVRDLLSRLEARISQLVREDPTGDRPSARPARGRRQRDQETAPGEA
jgi:polyhydroxyalkanoic acid synthase PhaR subunit